MTVLSNKNMHEGKRAASLPSYLGPLLVLSAFLVSFSSFATPTMAQENFDPSELKTAIQRCWLPAKGMPIDVPRIGAQFSKDGAVIGTPKVLNDREDPHFRSHAESAVRAILRCSPYKELSDHPESHDEWKDVVLNFASEGQGVEDQGDVDEDVSAMVQESTLNGQTHVLNFMDTEPDGRETMMMVLCDQDPSKMAAGSVDFGVGARWNATETVSISVDGSNPKPFSMQSEAEYLVGEGKEIWSLMKRAVGQKSKVSFSGPDGLKADFDLSQRPGHVEMIERLCKM